MMNEDCHGCRSYSVPDAMVAFRVSAEPGVTDDDDSCSSSPDTATVEARIKRD